jgi:hypothetical protein
MKKSLARTAAAAVLAGLAIVGVATPALAFGSSTQDNGAVAVVDQPDTSNLNNLWTFAPLGVPLLGLLQSLNAVPGRLLPAV